MGVDKHSKKSANSESEPDPLLSYLEYFRNVENPGFAVLVTGAWGSGKTFQVNAALGRDCYHYVSLFGLTSNSEIHGAVLAKAFPETANRKNLAKWFEGKNIGLAGFNVPAGSVIAAALNAVSQEAIDKNKVIVFDDLERCEVEHQTLLGVLNFYVEHHGCRVVVIAHSDEILEQFKRTKEKVFGHTVAVTPNADDAFESFARELSTGTQSIVNTHRVSIMELFEVSGCQSLRVLRQALMGVERFCGLLEKEQLANTVVLKKLLTLHFAVSVEVLSGEMARDDLVDRAKSYADSWALEQKKDKSEKQQSTNAFGKSRAKYSRILDILNYDLSDDLLLQMIVDGHYSKAKLQIYFAESHTFDAEADWPPWRKFIDFDSQSDEVVEAAAQEMDKQFANREIVDLGELMHVVSLRIMRVKHGLLAGSREEAIRECLKYLDDLVDQKRFPLKPDFDMFDSHPAHGGFMFWGYDENADLFKSVRDHVLMCEKRSLEQQSPEIKKRILAALRESPEDLKALLNFSGEESAVYQTIPVMQCIPPTEFVKAFLKLPVEQWSGVRRILSERREMSSSHNSLASEKQWFEEFENEMTNKSKENAGTINGLRIERHIPLKR